MCSVWVTGACGGARIGLSRQAGFSLVEVLVTSVVVAIAVVGIALMLGTGSAWVSAGGDNRVALKLAQQKIEQLRSMTFGCIPLGAPMSTTPGTGAMAAVGGACTASQSYYEGPGATSWVTASGTPAPQLAPTSRFFTRVTCVQYVTDNNIGTPAYTGGAGPTAATCLQYVNPGSNTSCAALSASCIATNTKRIVVVVTPTASAGTERIEEQPAVILQGWITLVPGGI
jgi:prepilin-type N-terminal cleavage/methylation domain-containing protein